ncbi:MAG: hypothetical protein PHP75_03280 [Methylacidiphilaceae bacterium]|nr:hypothetical protein [Candidatus Methylacidiphilaceae bacterium]
MSQDVGVTICFLPVFGQTERFSLPEGKKLSPRSGKRDCFFSTYGSFD